MRIRVLSDIHGNLEALRAVTATEDQIWVLGDLVNYGPNPAEVLEFVRQRAAVVVRGNHDHAIGTGTDPRCSNAFRDMARAMQAYTECVLTNEQKAWLRELPLTAQREVDGRRFFLCHALPSDPLYRYAPPDSPDWPAEAASVNADVLLTGHTHLPFARLAGGRLVVNPGSVGQPKHGRPEACYAIWDGAGIRLQTQAYDVERTAARVLELPVEARIREHLAAVLRAGAPPPAIV